jgi:putative DNA-invertase from lambdoid prophage Rac
MGSKLRLGYVRVSTATGEQLAALESQRHRIEAAGVDEVIEDVQSGRESDRAGFMKLLELINRGQVQEVLFTRVDRLGRDAADTDAVIAFAAKKGVTLTALDGGSIESETPQGFVMSRIMTTMAEMESRMLSMRIKAGLRERRGQKRPIRGRAPWGYQISKDKSCLTLDPEQCQQAQLFLSLLQQNNWQMSTAMTAWEAQTKRRLPLRTEQSVRNWVLNPILRGGTGYLRDCKSAYKEISWNTHQAILSQADYESIRAKFEQNKRMWGFNNQRRMRLLTSLCRCFYCDHVMPYAGGRKHPAVVCRTRGCPQHYKSTHERAIAGAVNAALSARSTSLAELVAVEPPEVEALQKAIAQLEALNDPDLSEVIAAKRSKMRKLHNREKVNETLVQLVSQPQFWQNYSYEELTELYHALVQAVVIQNQAVAEVLLRF